MFCDFLPWCGLFIIIMALVLISGAAEREGGREQEKVFWGDETKTELSALKQYSDSVLMSVNMDSNGNHLIDVCLCEAVFMYNPVERCVAQAVTYVCSPSLGVRFWRRMLLYPVWIYFPTLGGEGTFVRVGVKTEFSASWLPPRMRTVRMMGHREDPPPPPRGHVCFSKARGRSSPCGW